MVTARQLATLVNGNLIGDGDMVIHNARPLAEAQAGDITFLENDKQVPRLHASQASAAVVSLSLTAPGKTLIQVQDPLMAFVAIARHFLGRVEPAPSGIDPRAIVADDAVIGPEPSIHALAVIGPGTRIGARCRIHAGVVIGPDCVLGDDVTLHPRVVLYDHTVLGDRVILHAGAVIGADGFGYRFQEGRHAKVPQLGHVEIGADVEVGANSAIDRSTFAATRIGAGTKIDNLVQIAHNVQIGKHNLLAGLCGIAGSVSTEDYVVLAGQVGVADQVHIGQGAVVGAQSGVISDLPAGQRRYWGIPALPERDVKRSITIVMKLPEMRQDVRRILKHLGLDAKSESDKAA